MTTFAGKPCSPEQVRATAGLLRWYRAFIRSDCERAHVPGDWTRSTMDKAEAQHRLSALVETAINRKAGLDVPRGRKDDYDYQIRLYRDCQRVRDRVNRRIRVYQFETEEVRSRFRHLLSRYDD